jgi:acyl carrier protein
LANEEPRVLRRHLALPQAYAAPRTATEQRLAEIWRAVLNMDCVGVDDDYSDLGGDSYSATVIFALIEEAFGVHLPVARLIGAPTIAALAREIGEAQRSSGTPVLRTIDPCR